jgi:hypothetical protein
MPVRTTRLLVLIHRIHPLIKPKRRLGWAVVWSRLEAEVTVVEFLGGIGGAGIDEEVVSS